MLRNAPRELASAFMGDGGALVGGRERPARSLIPCVHIRLIEQSEMYKDKRWSWKARFYAANSDLDLSSDHSMHPPADCGVYWMYRIHGCGWAMTTCYAQEGNCFPDLSYPAETLDFEIRFDDLSLSKYSEVDRGRQYSYERI